MWYPVHAANVAGSIYTADVKGFRAVPDRLHKKKRKQHVKFHFSDLGGLFL